MTKQPSASAKAKQAGLPNLSVVISMTQVRRSTLDNWAKYKPVLFDIVLAGCVAQYERGGGDTGN